MGDDNQSHLPKCERIEQTINVCGFMRKILNHLNFHVRKKKKLVALIVLGDSYKVGCIWLASQKSSQSRPPKK